MKLDLDRAALRRALAQLEAALDALTPEDRQAIAEQVAREVKARLADDQRPHHRPLVPLDPGALKGAFRWAPR